MTTLTATTIECPTWCNGRHPRNEPEGSHNSTPWTTDDLSVVVEAHPEYGTLVGVEHVGDNALMHITPDQARWLGENLIRAASMLEGQSRLAVDILLDGLAALVVPARGGQA